VRKKGETKKKKEKKKKKKRENGKRYNFKNIKVAIVSLQFFQIKGFLRGCRKG